MQSTVHSGVFCWVHERSECTLQNTKICTVLCIFGGRDLISSMNYVCGCECITTVRSTNVLSVSVQAFRKNLHHIWFNLALLTLSANSYKTNLSTKRCWSSYVLALVHCTLHRADLKVVCLYSHWERLYSIEWGHTDSIHYYQVSRHVCTMYEYWKVNVNISFIRNFMLCKVEVDANPFFNVCPFMNSP